MHFGLVNNRAINYSIHTGWWVFRANRECGMSKCKWAACDERVTFLLRDWSFEINKNMLVVMRFSVLGDDLVVFCSIWNRKTWNQ